MPRQSKECILFVKAIKVCTCCGESCEEIEVHHEPPKSQKGSSDVRIVGLKPGHHRGPGSRHALGPKFWDKCIDSPNPTPEQRREWLEAETRWWWPGLLALYEYHGPIPTTDEQMWEVLDTLGLVTEYRKHKRSKRGSVTKKFCKSTKPVPGSRKSTKSKTAPYNWRLELTEPELVTNPI
jgi:hypothetical protein